MATEQLGVKDLAQGDLFGSNNGGTGAALFPPRFILPVKLVTSATICILKGSFNLLHTCIYIPVDKKNEQKKRTLYGKLSNLGE